MSENTKTRAGRYLVGALLIVAGLGYAGLELEWFGGKDVQAIEGAVVRRGPLRISEIVGGELKAGEAVSLKNEMEGGSTILYLIEEGTSVKPGDIVAELDTNSLARSLQSQTEEVEKARAEDIKARESYEIQVIQNESDQAIAKQKAEFAVIDKSKYLEGDWPQQEQKAKETITLKQEELARAKDKLEWTEKLAEGGFVQRTELEADQFSVERARIEYEQSVRDLELLREYTHPRQLAELDALIAETHREVLKVDKQARARLADLDAERNSAERRLSLEEEEKVRMETQMECATITSPVEGIVVYGRSSSRYGRGEPVQEGGEVRERQVVVSIPQSGTMIVEASLHETVLKKVEVGQPCDVVIDAIPGRVFAGRVEFVALLPDSGSWYSNPNQRIYRARVTILEPIEEMRPGMSCNVEILAADLEDVLYVPVQSVFVDAGKTVCFRRSSTGVERVEVEVGLDNSMWVVVASGLAEGDTVLLSPPPGFTPAPAEQSLPDGRANEREAPPSTSSVPGAGGPTSRGDSPREHAAQGGESGGLAGFPGGKPSEEQLEQWRKMRAEGGGQDRPGGGRPASGGGRAPSGGDRGASGGGE